MGEEWILHGRNLDNSHTWTSYTLNLTSQKWLNDEDYSPTSEAKSIWWHMLVVIVPDTINWKNNGTLWITGHGMGYRPTSNLDEDVALAASLAMGVGCITGVLFQVPNEDITFAADTIQMSRGEDEIIAFTWYGSDITFSLLSFNSLILFCSGITTSGTPLSPTGSCVSPWSRRPSVPWMRSQSSSPKSTPSSARSWTIILWLARLKEDGPPGM
jgi:hypothetical protein